MENKPTYEELQAQVGALLKALEYADNKLYILTHNRKDVSQRLIGDADKAFKVVRDTLSQAATPQHHLRELRAEAGRAGYLQGHLDALGDADEIDKEHSAFRANQYADQIRKGEVK